MMIVLEHLAMMLLTGVLNFQTSEKLFVFASSLQSVQILQDLSTQSKLYIPEK